MSRLRLVLAALTAFAAFAAPACDPVHQDAVDALGGEKPGVPRGPTHRPGEPCLLCHDGKIGDPRQFSVAGTVFQHATDTQGMSGVAVNLTDMDGHTTTLTTNSAGNFFASPTQWNPHYPVQVSLSYGGQTQKMQSHVGRDGSCAGCHFDPQQQGSPGHVYFYGDPP